MNFIPDPNFDSLIDKPIGIILNGATLQKFYFVVNPEYRERIRFGEYVLTKDAYGHPIFGVVESLMGVNRILAVYEGQGITKDELQTILNSEELRNISELVIAEVQVLGRLQVEFRGNTMGTVSIRANKYPIVPLSEVYLPSKQLLKSIFEEGATEAKERISIGYLLNFFNYESDEGEVEVHLDVNKLLSRHFAILAVTGAGKTNTVLVLASKLVEEFNGTVIVLDYHGEYVTLGELENKHKLPFEINVIKHPAIRPADISFEELQRLLGIGPKHVNMIEALRRAMEKIKNESNENTELQNSGSKYVDRLKEVLESLTNDVSIDGKIRDGASRVHRNINIKEDLLKRILLDIGKYDVVRSLLPGALNIIDLSSFTEDEAIVLVSYLARTILRVRSKIVRGEKLPKNDLSPAFKYPLVLIIEEAHVFLDPNKAKESAYWISRIAREGRKFGVSLGIVSQRPKRLETDVLSQCNTFIVLRLIEEQDRRNVKNSSEMITDNLAKALTTLDVGEALVVGYAVPARIPVTVRIHDFKKLYNGAKYGGMDISFTKEWKKMGNTKDNSIDADEIPL